ncbi:MAG TPA: ABC transporter ATP-binding protein [Gaiellales bacterium]|jgi:oligopeptide/dipeptide ABC transporter ATP-binding protein
MSEPLLSVRGLRVTFRTEAGLVRAVDDLDLDLHAGEVLGVVGESGSGKSVSMLAMLGLIDDPNVVIEGEAVFRGRNLLTLPERRLREIRGREAAMIFQDPMTSLNPVHRIGWQIAEQIRAHEQVTRRAAARRAVELLRSVGIPEPEHRARDYPHQFSGGMRQRVMIAMALSCSPALLIADEPTTALDVTIQAQILELLDRLRAESGAAVILITHDIGVVAGLADRVMVMYAGRAVERATTLDLFDRPQHPYTWGLMGSVPRLDGPKPARLAAIPGQPPSLIDLPTGCAFAPRCGNRFDRCTELVPALEARVGAEHLDACLLPQASREDARAGQLGGAPEAAR